MTVTAQACCLFSHKEQLQTLPEMATICYPSVATINQHWPARASREIMAEFPEAIIKHRNSLGCKRTAEVCQAPANSSF
jgi:hypothetical protein